MQDSVVEQEVQVDFIGVKGLLSPRYQDKKRFHPHSNLQYFTQIFQGRMNWIRIHTDHVLGLVRGWLLDKRFQPLCSASGIPAACEQRAESGLA